MMRLLRHLAGALLLLAPITLVSAQENIITGFTLVNADTDVAIQPINNGDVIDLWEVDPDDNIGLTIRVDTASDAQNIDLVMLDFNDGATVRSESTPPYYLAGDIEGDAYAVNSLKTPGKFSLEAQIYSGGSIVDSETIEFRMIDTDGLQGGLEPTVAPSDAYDVPGYDAEVDGKVHGELKKWHKITVAFAGPPTGERNNVENPFTLYQFNVTFTHVQTSKSYTVPGYYAADGNAANSGAVGGTVWLVHFRPDEIGTWEYLASFGVNQEVADLIDARDIIDGGFFDDAFGAFDVAPTDKTGRDLRGKGRLEYVGEHHLRFAETGEYFIKAGADSPENFLAYEDFDNTPNNGGWRKNWAPHIGDYNDGDPTWANGKGKGIIGAVNYLAEKGMNVISFLPMNIGGDDKNVFPYISDAPEDFDRIDVSKTAQWEIVLDHAEQNGFFLHFKTQETENDQLLDGGALGPYRKLYYRELIARFGHHLALNWNLGEENTNTDAQRKAYADFFKENDPYNHPVVMHTYPGAQEPNYSPLLGYPNFDGASIQIGLDKGFSETLKWVTRSAEAGHKWIVSYDESAPSTRGVVPDSDDPTHDEIRINKLWANYMAGGCGVEYYFGYSFDNSDLSCQDFRSRENMWDQSRVALDFFEKYVPFWRMSNANDRITNNNWCLFERDGGATIACYLPNGGFADVDLTDIETTGDFEVKWYDPLKGGDLLDGSIATLPSDTTSFLGEAPYNPDQDWAVLIKAPQPTEAPTASPIKPSPTKAPVVFVPPVAPPTSAPVVTVTAQPVAQPTTEAPVVAPVSLPLEVTESPVAVVVDTESPVAAPVAVTESPVVAPVAIVESEAPVMSPVQVAVTDEGEPTTVLDIESGTASSAESNVVGMLTALLVAVAALVL